MGHNYRNLSEHVIALSEGATWEAAKAEWVLDHVEILFEGGEKADPETCPCGHYPITELCWIRNTENGNLTFVGNVCVKRFMGMPADTVAQGFRRVLADPEAALNEAATRFAYAQGWITSWEQTFCLSTSRKRNLSVKQHTKRIQINNKLLQLLRARGVERRRQRP